MKNIFYRRSRLIKNGMYSARVIVVLDRIRVYELFKNLDFDRFHIIHVLDENLNLVRILTEAEVIDKMMDCKTDMSIKEFLETNIQVKSI